jgi:hypothetical protein
MGAIGVSKKAGYSDPMYRLDRYLIPVYFDAFH